MSSEALIVAGPNGAGKTTFAEEYVAEHPRPFLSADAIAQRLRPARPAQAWLQAGRAFFAELDALIRSGESFVVESTLAGLGYGRILERLKEVGYTVTIAFLFLESPASCVARVEERVRKGGHDVPRDDIVRRFHRSKRNFWNVYRHMADFWILVYNASEGFQDVATGEGAQYEVGDEVLFQQFMQDIEGPDNA